MKLPRAPPVKFGFWATSAAEAENARRRVLCTKIQQSGGPLLHQRRRFYAAGVCWRCSRCLARRFYNTACLRCRTDGLCVFSLCGVAAASFPKHFSSFSSVPRRPRPKPKRIPPNQHRLVRRSPVRLLKNTIKIAVHAHSSQ